MTDRYIDMILERYPKETTGWWHTRAHIVNMLEGLTMVNAMRNVNGGDYVSNVAELAILFHDVVCVPGAKDNEEVSAAIARMELGRLPVKPEAIDAVAEIIKLTVPGREPIQGVLSDKDMEVWQIVHDLDWAALRTGWSIRDMDEKVIKEYMDAGFPRAKVLAGRAAFIRGLVDSKEVARHGIYRWPRFRTNWNDGLMKVLKEDAERLEALAKTAERPGRPPKALSSTIPRAPRRRPAE